MKRAKQRKYRRTLTEMWRRVWRRHSPEVIANVTKNNAILRKLMEDKK